MRGSKNFHEKNRDSRTAGRFPALADRGASAWEVSSEELARFVHRNLLNRDDVWGEYLLPQNRREDGPKLFTAPRLDDRGLVSLDVDALIQHFRGNRALGVHAQSANVDGTQTSKYCAWDIDAHGESAVAENENTNTMLAIVVVLVEMGAIPLIERSIASTW